MGFETPKVSVVMPVRNGRPFLDEAISSILQQTYSDFEFVILDDASSDGSVELLREWERRDARIRIFQSEKNLGLSGSSNFIVGKARGPVVARMDADDISLPYRLQSQMQILEGRPDVVAVGTLCDGIDASGKLTRPRDRWRVVRRSNLIPFPHGSVMFRRSAFEAVKGYCESFAGAEDQDIFYRMSAVGKIVTLPDVLYRYRYHFENATLSNGERAVKPLKETTNGHNRDLAAFYMLGAMRLWSGSAPNVLGDMLRKKSVKWNARTLMALGAAGIGNLSPATLRFMLRTLIRSRDFLAGMKVTDGRPYEWRLK